MRDRLILTLAALAAFGASLGSSFHFDDYAIFADPSIATPAGWWEVWRPIQTRPLTFFTFWLNFEIGGKHPIGYHALNLALHLAAVLLLYDVLRRLLDRPAALFAAAVFAVHPMQAEAVNYIWARGTLLMTVFCLLSWRSWLAKRYWMAVLWFGLALLGKEECAAFPLFLLLGCGVSSLGRAAPLGAMLMLSAGAGLRVLYALHVTAGAPAGEQAGMTAAQYQLAQGPVIWRYARLLVIPWGFTVDPEISVPPLWLGLLAWTGIGTIVWLCRRNRWLLGGLVLLAPSSSIFPAADLSADRRLYLPLIALSAAAAIGSGLRPQHKHQTTELKQTGQQTKEHRHTTLLQPSFLLPGIVAVLALLSIGRTMVWMSEKSLWREAVERAPDKIRPKLQLARVSEPAEAANLLAEAKKLAPTDPAVASESGKQYLLLGRPLEALPEFGRALALSPRDAQAFNNRGVALLALGQADVARRDFEHALQIDPCLFDPRYNLLSLGIRTPLPAGCRYTAEQSRLLSVKAP